MSQKVIQLDMFRSQKEEESEIFKKSVEKSLRGLFARYNEVCLMVDEIHRRLDRISEEVYRDDNS